MRHVRGRTCVRRIFTYKVVGKQQLLHANEFLTRTMNAFALFARDTHSFGIFHTATMIEFTKQTSEQDDSQMMALANKLMHS